MFEKLVCGLVGRRLMSSSGGGSGQTFVGYLQKKIEMKGPLTVAEYMKECLANPKYGYYMKKSDVLGSKGDFITSPEVSQMFGELIGVWFLNEWRLLKHFYGSDLPKTVQLVELGPGRGTLMNDLLSVWSRHSLTHSSDINVFMVESSPVMRAYQLRLLTNTDADGPNILDTYQTKYKNIKVTWIQDMIELPKLQAPQFFLANEFFDALPVQKFQRTPEGHRELLVDVSSGKDTSLEMKISKGRTIGSDLVLKLYPGFEEHEHVEVSVEAARNMEAVSRRIEEMNGSALLVDYGHDGKCEDTLRAFRQHKLVGNIFEMPGECDLTADVDFKFLRYIASKSNVVCYGPETQKKFLEQMQIGARLKALLEKCVGNDEERAKLISGVEMLTENEQMGMRFKMMAIRKFDWGQEPPGFISEKKD